MTRVVVCLLTFWAMQIVAQMFLKWGSMSNSRWLWGFILGNVMGASSVWLLMILYKNMNVNVAMGIGAGGAFLFSQIVLFFVFESKVTPLQWVGIVAISIGMVTLALGGAKAPEEGVVSQIAAVEQEKIM